MLGAGVDLTSKRTAARSTWSSPPPRSSASRRARHAHAVVLPGGLGEHKWRDRLLIAELERQTGAVPLLVDFDGEVLEAGQANLWIAEDDTLVTPPLNGRLLPGTMPHGC